MNIMAMFRNGNDFLVPTKDADIGTRPTWQDEGHLCRERRISAPNWTFE